MAVQSSKSVRSKIDHIRQVIGRDQIARQQIDADPVGYLAAQGALSSDQRDIAAQDGVHMCPWHTCQATRHGLEEPVCVARESAN